MIQMAELLAKEHPTHQEHEQIARLRRYIQRRINRDVALVFFLRTIMAKLREDIGPYVRYEMLQEARRVHSCHLDLDTEDEGEDLVEHNAF